MGDSGVLDLTIVQDNGSWDDKLAAVGGTSTVLIGVAIASSSAMILPISTPPNALAYATNLIQQKDMIKMGIIVGAISVVLGYLVLFAAGSLNIV